jgi:uncharacterized membrane protein
MTQIEFIEQLNTCLTGKVSAGTVQENIAYYKQYFAEQMVKGVSEEAVCASLGSPQLIAKGILEAEKFQSNSDSGYEQEVNEERNFRNMREKRARNTDNLRLPSWLTWIFSIVMFFVVTNIVLTVFSVVAPLILPICIVLFVIHIFKNTF